MLVCTLWLYFLHLHALQLFRTTFVPFLESAVSNETNIIIYATFKSAKLKTHHYYWRLITAGIKIHWLLIVVNEVHNVLKSVYLDMWSTQSTCHVAHTSRRGTRTIANLTSKVAAHQWFLNSWTWTTPEPRQLLPSFFISDASDLEVSLHAIAPIIATDDTSINQQPTKKPLSEVMVTNTTNNLSCVHWHHDTQKWECISSWYISMERIVHHQDLQLQILRKQEQEPSL